MTRKNQNFNCGTLHWLRRVYTVWFIDQITKSAWHTNNRFNHFEAKKGSTDEFLNNPGHLAVVQDVRVQKFRIWHHISKKRCGPKFDRGKVSKFSYFSKSVRQQPFVSKYQFFFLLQPFHNYFSLSGTNFSEKSAKFRRKWILVLKHLIWLF